MHAQFWVKRIYMGLIRRRSTVQRLRDERAKLNGNRMMQEEDQEEDEEVKMNDVDLVAKDEEKEELLPPGDQCIATLKEVDDYLLLRQTLCPH